MVNNITVKSPEEYRRDEKRRRVGAVVKNVLVYTGLILWAAAILFPFLWMLIISFETTSYYTGTPSLLIEKPTFLNYVVAFTEYPLGKYLLNTLIYTVVTTATMLVVIIPAAYAFARLKFRGKNVVFAIFLALMMIPSELVIITNYVTVGALGLSNMASLVLPSAVSVFYIYLLKENFAQVPDNLYLAAKVDGAGDFKYLMRVMLPICKPTVITVTILKVIECWNSYVWPSLITKEEADYLVSLGIEHIKQANIFGNTPGVMAAVCAVSLPLIVIFLIFRDKIMNGVARGGTKG